MKNPEEQVNHPDHYNADPNFEAIKVIKAWTKPVTNPYVAFCLGNVLKYICRFPFKGGVQSLEKAVFYLNEAIGELKKDEQ